MPEILLRALLAALIFLAGLAVYTAWNRIQIERLRKPLKGLEYFQAGLPAILYFTTPDCQPCKTMQRPALERLTSQWRLQVIEVNATDRPDLSDYWGVLSVPTTFVIDSKGQPRGINHGVASTEKLIRQLETAEGGSISRLAVSPSGKEKAEGLGVKVES